MEIFKEEFSKLLANSKALFFADGLFLKDGRSTPYFVNVGNFADSANLRWQFASAYASMIENQIKRGLDVDVLFGPAYKGILLAGDTTLVLLNKYGRDLGCSFNRKEAKTHGEASGAKTMLVGSELRDGCNIYMIDDVGTSMDTKREALEVLANVADADGITLKVTGIGIAVDREQVGPVYDTSKTGSNKERVILGERGQDAIDDFVKETGIPVHSIVGIRDVVDLLFRQEYPLKINGEIRPMDNETHEKFLEYMETYGARR